MNASLDAGGFPRLRRLAQLSILLAMASVLATAESLMLLPNAAAAGQWIIVAAGTIVSVSAFVFGVAISLGKPLARRAGFAAVAVAFPTAALFGLVAYAAPESAWIFGVWTIALLAYASLATHRLVHWPADDWHDQPKSTLAIFISYRRDDSRETVGRIHDHLRQSFDDKHIFLDVEDEAAGEDYRMVIDRELERADVLLAVIGERWLAVTGRDGKRRLDDPADMVRIELETALHRRLRIIPVLLDDTRMPAATDLPPSLHPLCYRTAVRLRRDPDFNPDVQRFVLTLRASEPQASGNMPIGA